MSYYINTELVSRIRKLDNYARCKSDLQVIALSISALENVSGAVKIVDLLRELEKRKMQNVFDVFDELIK